eukprot:scaffold47390_cov49-Attheya_sp.AAC.3
MVLLVNYVFIESDTEVAAFRCKSHSFFPSQRRRLSTSPFKLNSAFGYCVDCGVSHTLPSTPEARDAALELVALLERSPSLCLDLVQTTSSSTRTNFVDPHHLFKQDNETTPFLTSQDLEALPTTLWTEQRGKMIGVLVCELNHTSRKSRPPTKIVLIAFAGAVGGRWDIPGWVPAIGITKDEPIEWTAVQYQVAQLSQQMKQVEFQLQQYQHQDDPISNRDAKLAQLKDDWSRLRDHRVEASRQALAIYRDQQNVTNFKQIRNNQSNPYRTLESIYLESIQFQQQRQQDTLLLQHKEQTENVCSNQIRESRRARKRRRRRPGHMAPIPKGMPVGVGDCCATKLLAFCSHYNRHSKEAVLKPVGIAEVFFGTSRQTQQARDPKSLLDVATKTDPASTTISGRSKQVKTLVQNDGTFFDACKLRCQPVLGFLLCGLDDMSQAIK